MGVEIWLPFFTRPRELALTVDAMGLGVKSSIKWVNAGQRWQHECQAGGIPIDALIYIIAIKLGTAHCSALVYVLGDRGTCWIEVVREADNLSGICVPKWTLQVQVAVGRQTDNYRLAVNRQASRRGPAWKQSQVGYDNL